MGSSCSTTSGPWANPAAPALSSGPLLGALAAVHLDRSLWARSWPASASRCPTTSSSRCCARSTPLSGGRLVAGIGTGDRLSRQENDAYGIPFEAADNPPSNAWASVAMAVAGVGLPVWIGGGCPEKDRTRRARHDRRRLPRLAGGRRPGGPPWWHRVWRSPGAVRSAPPSRWPRRPSPWWPGPVRPGGGLCLAGLARGDRRGGRPPCGRGGAPPGVAGERVGCISGAAVTWGMEFRRINGLPPYSSPS